MTSDNNISSFDCRLRVKDLSPATHLLSGNIYAVAEEDNRLSAALIWGTIAEHCSNGNAACLVSVSGPEKTLAGSALEDLILPFFENRKLAVLETGDGLEKLSGKARLRRFVDDLRHWKRSKRQLIIVDGADLVFADLDISLLRELRDWAEEQNNILVLVFRQSGHNAGESLDAIVRVSQAFAGMARLKSRYGVASWEIFHWFNPGGLVSNKTFPLRCGADGLLEVYEEVESDQQAADPAVDETQIIAVKTAFLPKETVPADWRIVEDDLEAMPALASGAVAATVVLSFTPSTNFNLIARCVFDLRKQCGARLKIVIREVNSRLRYSQETLAVRLGANLIVPAEISYVRFLSLTSMVQGQVFPHNLPASYDKALADAMPEQEQGYLAPQDFTRSVQTILERSRVLNVQNAMVRLPLAYGLQPFDALRYCTIKRDGDLCTSDEANVYVFLYACRESDIDKTLDRLFGLPVSELFSTEERYLTARGIEEGIQEFEDRRRAGNFPDLTAELAGVAESTVRPERTEAPVAAVEQKGPATVRYSAPPPAVRRPLPLRGTPTLTDVSVSSS
jgi:cellulose biosynthesis protein BcsE